MYPRSQNNSQQEADMVENVDSSALTEEGKGEKDEIEEENSEFSQSDLSTPVAPKLLSSATLFSGATFSNAHQLNLKPEKMIKKAKKVKDPHSPDHLWRLYGYGKKGQRRQNEVGNVAGEDNEHFYSLCVNEEIERLESSLRVKPSHQTEVFYMGLKAMADICPISEIVWNVDISTRNFLHSHQLQCNSGQFMSFLYAYRELMIIHDCNHEMEKVNKAFEQWLEKVGQILSSTPENQINRLYWQKGMICGFFSPVESQVLLRQMQVAISRLRQDKIETSLTPTVVALNIEGRLTATCQIFEPVENINTLIKFLLPHMQLPSVANPLSAMQCLEYYTFISKFPAHLRKKVQAALEKHEQLSRLDLNIFIANLPSNLRDKLLNTIKESQFEDTNFSKLNEKLPFKAGFACGSSKSNTNHSVNDWERFQQENSNNSQILKALLIMKCPQEEINSFLTNRKTTEVAKLVHYVSMYSMLFNYIFLENEKSLKKTCDYLIKFDAIYKNDISVLQLRILQLLVHKKNTLDELLSDGIKIIKELNIQMKMEVEVGSSLMYWPDKKLSPVSVDDKQDKLLFSQNCSSSSTTGSFAQPTSSALFSPKKDVQDAQYEQEELEANFLESTTPSPSLSSTNKQY